MLLVRGVPAGVKGTLQKVKNSDAAALSSLSTALHTSPTFKASVNSVQRPFSLQAALGSSISQGHSTTMGCAFSKPIYCTVLSFSVFASFSSSLSRSSSKPKSPFLSSLSAQDNESSQLFQPMGEADSVSVSSQFNIFKQVLRFFMCPTQLPNPTFVPRQSRLFKATIAQHPCLRLRLQCIFFLKRGACSKGT